MVSEWNGYMEAGRVGDDEPTSRTASLAAVQPLLVIDIDLMGPFKGIFRDIYGGVIDVINALWGGPMRELLKIDPYHLSRVNEIYDLSLLVYFSLLMLFGLTYLGSFQLFPTNQKTDPYRFMSRAMAATLSLLIINPPGDDTLFSLGAFGWALEIQNQMVDLFLAGEMVGASTGTPDGAFVQLALAIALVPLIIIVELILLVVLAARQIVIFLTYGLYPLFIAFWVADAGPLKHGKKLSAKFFKATGMLIPMGVVLAALFRVSSTFLDGSSGETLEPNETTGDAAGAVTATGVDAAFSTGIMDFIVTMMIVPATCLLGIKFVMDPLKLAGAGAGAAAGMAKRGMSKAGKKGKSAVGMGGGGSNRASGGGVAAGGGAATATAAHSGGRSSDVIDNSAPEPSKSDIAQYGDGSRAAAGGGGGSPPPRDPDDGTPGWRQGLEYGATVGTAAGAVTGTGPIAGVAGGLAGAAAGAVNDRFDLTGVASKKLAGTADGKIGQGIDKIRDAGNQAVDQDESEYGKMAAAGAVGGQIGGLAAGTVIPGVDNGKVADVGGKIGKAATGGVVGMGKTFHAQGGTEGFSDVATGVRNAGQNAASGVIDRGKGGWEKATGHLPDAVTDKTDVLGETTAQENAKGESDSDLIKEK